MAKNIELLLTETVENLGIVGDVVKVRTGYARNYLMPLALATKPSAEKIKELSAKRAEAERQLAELRKVREGIISRLSGHKLELVRSTNDQGILYAAVTQQEIAKLLGDQGFGVRARDVRLGQTIKRVGHYDLHIKFEADLEALVSLDVKADRKLDLFEEKEARPEADAAPADGEAPKAEGKPEAKHEAKHGKDDKKAAKPEGHKAEAKADDKPAKKERAKKAE